MSSNSLIRVHSTYDANEAEIIKGALESAGIDCEIDGEGQAGLTGILSIGLLVRESDVQRAKEIIQNHG